ncbi:hypothetical protein GCM10008955_25830 [Deinococcus malanensis]|uniref:Lipoprotein n=1 Tax=Deinococcus malanensis TaxID=1706855 RepID=A0ABQ2EX93_9DEIO|nr:hypothetical protein [Deinococcus malanensis]GGK30849.1 hypothetical protein GCM10008955_25830 [Deinococcus malanensis]
MKPRFALLALPLLLAACTGTEESTPNLPLVLLTDGGTTLRTLTPTEDTSSTPFTDVARQTVTGGVSVETLSSGRRFALTRTDGLDSRDLQLATPQPFGTLPFTPCLRQTATSAARDRLLTLSECQGGPQRLALYRDDGVLVWTALLPTFLPVAGTDVPPVRLAVVRDTAAERDVAVVSRPRMGGGSEVLRVAPLNTGDTVAEVSAPLPVPAVRDLVTYAAPGGTAQILAATDSGIQPLKTTGEPDAAAALKAFGTDRYDRLWAGPAGNRPLLAAWRNNVSSTGPLLLWDGVRATAATVTSFVSDLRDVTITPTGLLYTLSGNTLTRYDTAYGLTQGNWRVRTVISGLNDARSVTWLVP